MFYNTLLCYALWNSRAGKNALVPQSKYWNRGAAALSELAPLVRDAVALSELAPLVRDAAALSELAPLVRDAAALSELAPLGGGGGSEMMLK